MIGQLSIDGEELTGHEAVFPGLKTVEWPDEEPLHRGDRITVSVEYVVTHVSDGASVDARAIAKESVKRAYLTAPDKASVKVSSISRRAEDVQSATG